MSAAEVLAELLAGEHAAVFGYGVIGARLDLRRRALALSAFDDHRLLRDQLTALMTGRGLPTPGPALSYDVPVTTPQSAVQQAVALESGLGVLWRDLVASTDEAALRALAVRGLSATAVRAARWRASAGLRPLTTPWPGQPA